MESATAELFATETVAELSARQGRVADAIAIFRRLLETRPNDERAARWSERLATLESTKPEPPPDKPVENKPEPEPEPKQKQKDETPAHVMPLLIRETVRSGQIVYAQNTDLICLAPVNPGAQLLADGNIHVYAPLRGRAVAGVRGARDARIFCQRLEAELVGIDAAYVSAEGVPEALFGKAVQVRLEGERCIVSPL